MSQCCQSYIHTYLHGASQCYHLKDTRRKFHEFKEIKLQGKNVKGRKERMEILAGRRKKNILVCRKKKMFGMEGKERFF